jgi:hypothetical protein
MATNANGRINKSGLTTLQKTQLRKTLKERQMVKVLGSDYTHAQTDTDLADISGFKLPIEAGKTYIFTASLIGTGNASGGVKFGITGPTASFLIGQVQVDGTSTSAVSLATLVGGATAAAVEIFATGTYKATANGDFQVQAAQNASHASDSKILAGSFIKLEEVLP